MPAPCDSRSGYFGRLRLLRVIALAPLILFASRVGATELADRHQAICHDSASYRIVLSGVAPDRDTCASRNACFSYTLRCANGRAYALTWYLNPQAFAHEEFYAQHYPYFQIGLFGVLLLVAGIARGSGRPPRLPMSLPLLIVGVGLILSNVPATHVVQPGWPEFVWTGPVQLLVFLVTYVLMPALLLLLLVPFVRGIPRALAALDFLLRRHPAEPSVLAALREGTAIDTSALSNALMPNPRDIAGRKPTFRSRNQAARAHALAEKLEADAEIAEAIERRERARAALIRAKREVANAKRKGRRR